LHEVAAGTPDTTEELEYLSQARWRHFNFRLGIMECLSLEKKKIVLSPTLNDEGEELISRRSFSYDTLVIAVGSVSNSFAILGVEKHFQFLDNARQAFRFQKHLIQTFMRIYSRRLSNGKGIFIAIIGAADRLLPALPDRLSGATARQLGELGIQLMLGRRVVAVTESGVMIEDGEIVLADIKVWAAGIKGSDWLCSLDGPEIDLVQQMMVEESLQTTRDENIFAIGDCAACAWAGHEGNAPRERRQHTIRPYCSASRWLIVSKEKP
jgi:NADH dehydrogenase